MTLQDGFELKAWKDFFAGQDFHHIILDTHQYLMMAEMDGCEQTVEGYKAYIDEHFAKEIAEVQEYVDVICGEWCLFNSYAVGMDTKGGQSVLNGMDFSENKESMDEETKKQVYQEIAEAQLAAWRRGSGYFYWSYKVLLDTVNETNWIGWDSWDLGKSAALGWFPMGG